MSYCRFGDNDAYIYMTYEGFECCACSLATRTALEVPYIDSVGIPHHFDYEPVGPFTTAKEMLNHISEHRANGDYISADVDVQILSEYPDTDASVLETDEEREQRLKDSAIQRERILERMRASYEESSNG